MTYCTGDDVLDKAQVFVNDQSAGYRAKMLVWLSMTAQDLANRRTWKWLYTLAASTAITSSVLTLPSDYREFVSITFSDGNEYEFTESLTGLTFTPDVPTGVTADLTYIVAPDDFVDDTSATVFPYYARNALIYGVLANAFIFEKDPSLATYPSLYEAEVNKLKVADNRATPIPDYRDIGFPQRRNNLINGIL